VVLPNLCGCSEEIYRNAHFIWPAGEFFVSGCRDAQLQQALRDERDLNQFGHFPKI
jgi:hypothetical protein